MFTGVWVKKIWSFIKKRKDKDEYVAILYKAVILTSTML